ncbi:hypothetical protein NDU88_002536 [Pleurodeles waltl]|uniref:Uncharacterized protein n=1 Tax=Pleurodeles waltl TaxID=8319 RepID=A0AAV7LCR9_PLEWA|nr:hypothetical protein NDU88_002536 [Pleurodeles waltl]
MAALLVELKAGFRSMEERFDTITCHLDKLGEPLDRQGVEINITEERISSLEDSATAVDKRGEKLERVLKQAAVKCEDLEACCRAHKIQIYLALPRPPTWAEQTLLWIYSSLTFLIAQAFPLHLLLNVPTAC